MERFEDRVAVLTLATLCALAGEARAQIAAPEPSSASPPPPAAPSADQSVANVLVNASSVNDLKVRN